MPNRKKRQTVIRKYYQVIVNQTPEGPETNVDPSDLPRFNRVVPPPRPAPGPPEPPQVPERSYGEPEAEEEPSQKYFHPGSFHLYAVLPFLILCWSLSLPYPLHEYATLAYLMLALMNFKILYNWVYRSTTRIYMYWLFVGETILNGFGIDIHKYIGRFFTHLFS